MAGVDEHAGRHPAFTSALAVVAVCAALIVLSGQNALPVAHAAPFTLHPNSPVVAVRAFDETPGSITGLAITLRLREVRHLPPLGAVLRPREFWRSLPIEVFCGQSFNTRNGWYSDDDLAIRGVGIGSDCERGIEGVPDVFNRTEGLK